MKVRGEVQVLEGAGHRFEKQIGKGNTVAAGVVVGVEAIVTAEVDQ